MSVEAEVDFRDHGLTGADSWQWVITENKVYSFI